MTAPGFEPDVLVLGAGAAGLAAAAELAAHGRRVTVLEARDRLGGRILTQRVPSQAVPIELGAEFIHGRLAETFAWLERGRLDVVGAAGSHWSVQSAELAPAAGRFEALKAALGRVPRPARDVPVSALLEGPARTALTPDLRAFTRMLVEGFDAADLDVASAWELLDEWGVDGLGNTPAFRPRAGYGALVDVLAEAARTGRVELLLDTPVHAVRWRRGAVTADAVRDGVPFSAAAPRAIVTLPLGVLKLALERAGIVRFDPPLDAKRAALERIAVGPAVKLVMRFREPFWERVDDGRLRDAAFIHDARAVLPTYWTTLPERSTLLNAWAGGPNADRLAGRGRDELAQVALDSLAALLGVRPHALLEDVHMHDWQADPFAVGAYSYVAVGGQAARAELAAPLDDTLFFAGEATEHAVEAATVDGALRTGKRAAREALARM